GRRPSQGNLRSAAGRPGSRAAADRPAPPSRRRGQSRSRFRGEVPELRDPRSHPPSRTDRRRKRRFRQERLNLNGFHEQEKEMALKIRLARAGSKKRPYYHIVVADVRAPRDGRFIEQLGSWNPMLPKDAER